MKKAYTSPVLTTQELQLGVFGCYGDIDKDDDPIYGIKKEWFGLD